MQLYFSPELVKPETQIINVVDQNGNAVGYVNFIIDKKKMYVYGYLEDSGVERDFQDLVKPYLKGLQKANEDIEIMSYLAYGGEKVKLTEDEDSTS